MGVFMKFFNSLQFFSIFCSLFVYSCQHISVQDGAPESVLENHQRVETQICGSHKVGINGCFFADGKVDQNLQVYNVAKGALRVTGCGIDKNYRYDMKNGEWFDVELKGMELVEDCALTLYQAPEFPGQEKLQFPVKGYIGSVFLGRCLAKQTCEFYEAQGRDKFDYNVKRVIDDPGFFLLRGCGKELIPSTQINHSLDLNIGSYNENQGCVFYLLLKNSKILLKSVYWLNSYKTEAMLMERPVMVGNSFEGDKSTMAYIQDGKIFTKARGKIKDGFVRFYTSAGRSLIIEFKNGNMIWSQ